MKDQETIRIKQDYQYENKTYWLCPQKKHGKIKDSMGYPLSFFIYGGFGKVE